MAGTGSVVARPTGSETPDRARSALLAAGLATSMGLVVVAVSTGLVPVGLVGSGRPIATGGLAPAAVVVMVAACWMSVGNGSSAAVGVALVSMAGLMPGLSVWPALDPQARAGVLAAPPLALAGLALIVAGWPEEHRSHRRSLVTAVVLASAGALVHLLGYNPFFDPSCRWTCETSAAPLSALLGARPALALSAALTAAAAALVVVSLWERGARAVTTGPGTAASFGVAGVLIAAGSLVEVLGWSRDGTPQAADRLHSLGAGVVVCAVLATTLRARRIRRDVRDVVGQLTGMSPESGTGSSVMGIEFCLPADRRWVDVAGRPVGNEGSSNVAILSDAVGPAVRLLLGQRIEPARILSAITPAGRLALENARLHAAGLAHLADLRASQGRIVAATDEERRRIARDLHDGAQQRLVAVMMHLGSARTRASAGAASAALRQGEEQLRAALAALRDLAHGSLTEVLDSDGLGPAVQELADAAPLLVDLTLTLGDRRPPASVQTAAYLVVASGLDNVVRHAGTECATVLLAEATDGLLVEVTDAGRGGAVIGSGLSEVADRIGAVGGTMLLSSIPGTGTTLAARFPCGW
jgi:signal transduction histidine kinase